jgi:tetratricopeptide (TPR) repeat protein
MILNRIGSLYASSGENAVAVELYTRALALLKTSNNPSLAAVIHGSLGRLHLEAKNWPAARIELDQALRIFRECGDKRGHATTLLSLGMLDQATGAELLISAASLFHEIGDAAAERNALDLVPERKDAAAAKDKPA